MKKMQVLQKQLGTERRNVCQDEASFKDSMKGRTMYAIPFSMGRVGTEFSKIGIELTDSMHIMTHVGAPVIEELNKGADFCQMSPFQSADRCREEIHSPLPLRTTPSGASTPHMAAMFFWARNVLHCVSVHGWDARKAGWPSICS